MYRPPDPSPPGPHGQQLPSFLDLNLNSRNLKPVASNLRPGKHDLSRIPEEEGSTTTMPAADLHHTAINGNLPPSTGYVSAELSPSLTPVRRSTCLLFQFSHCPKVQCSSRPLATHLPHLERYPR